MKPRLLISLSCILLIIAVLLPACGGSTVTISPLTISPEKVGMNQPVTIAANLLNSGEKAEDYTAELKINGKKLESQKLTIAAGETKTVSFQYTPKELGQQQVTLNAQTGTFEVVNSAVFIVESLTITPDPPFTGRELTANATVKNTGGLAGSFSASLKVDGTAAGSADIAIEPGSSGTCLVKFSINAAGKHSIELGGTTKDLQVIQAPEFTASTLIVNPTLALTGQPVNVQVTITNTGTVKDTQPVVLLANGTEAGTQTVTLEPGANGNVNFTLTRDTAGTYSIGVKMVSGSLAIVDWKTYNNTPFFYSIQYPPDFNLNDSDPTSVAIDKSGIGGVVILVDRQAFSETASAYYDVIAQGKRQQLPDWTATNRTEVIENGTVIGYKYDYTNTVSSKEWVGRGVIIKRAGYGYYAVFTTTKAEWEKYKFLANQVIDSFNPPKIFSGAYSNETLGITLQAPPEWNVIETSNMKVPLYVSTPTGQATVVGQLMIETVPAGVTTQQYLSALISAASLQGTTSPFPFNDSSSGLEVSSSFTSSGQSATLRLISLVTGSRALTFVFSGTTSNVNAQAASITALARSLVVSTPGAVKVNRNESLVMLEGEIPTLDPAVAEESPAGYLGAIYSGLVRIDKDLKVVPDLAEKWTVSADRKTYTFTLRQNAKFHDGRAVTAADVKYSWERACDPALKSPKAGNFLGDIVGAKERLAGTTTTISGIKVINENTLEVTIDAPKQYFLSELAQPVAFVVDKVNVATGAAWWEKPNGTGAFKLKTWEKDTLLVMERNDAFYLEPAKLKNLVFRMFAGNSLQLYETGEIDITGVSTTNQDKVLDPANPLNKELVTGATLDIAYISLNVTKPPFDDPNIRKALALALDVPKLLEVIMKNRASQAAGFVPPGIPGNNPALKPLTFNLTEAKQLITQSKYGSADKVPAITLYTLYQAGPLDLAIVAAWQALGLQVKVEAISQLDEYLRKYHNKELQAYAWGWNADYADPQNFLEILFGSRSPENGSAYSNPELDALLARAAAETDTATRLKLYQDAEKLILSNLPAIPLWWATKSYVLVKPYVQGYVATPLAVNIWREISVLPH
jgi:oligopeptide transport system substrate-binding protein